MHEHMHVGDHFLSSFALKKRTMEDPPRSTSEPPRAHWMRDVKRQLQRNATKGLRNAQTVKSVVVQARVGMILEQRNRRGLHGVNETDTSQEFTQSLADVDARSVLNVPSRLVKKSKSAYNPEAVRIAERVRLEMRRRNLPDITSAMLVSYVEDNAERVKRQMDDLSHQLHQAIVRKQAEELAKAHKHVYPGDVVASQIASGTTSTVHFPKDVMHVSEQDVRTTRNGGSSPHGRNGTPEDVALLSEQGMDLEPIHLITSDGGGSDYFGAHIVVGAPVVGPPGCVPQIVLNNGLLLETPWSLSFSIPLGLQFLRCAPMRQWTSVLDLRALLHRRSLM